MLLKSTPPKQKSAPKSTPPKQNIVTNISNAKRIESCRKIGSEKKIKGHKREGDFKTQYCKNCSEIVYGATADATLDKDSYIIKRFSSINIGNDELNVSIKSGKNIQFVLGNIPELLIQENLQYISNKINSKKIFNKYLKKDNSVSPVNILCYKDSVIKKWIFFNIDCVINFIVEKCTWRKLNSGRLKGDFKDSSKKGASQYLTYEYRTNHKSYFLGLNGNKGDKFINLLKENIPYLEDDFLFKEIKNK